MRRAAALAILAGSLALVPAPPSAGAEAIHPFLYARAGMSWPCGVAVDSVGNVYVGNSKNNKIYIFGPGKDGPLIKEIVGERPCSLAVDSKGNVYAKELCCGVQTTLGKAVRYSPSSYPPTSSTVYSASSTLIAGEPGSRVTAVAVGPGDHVFVDREDRIAEFDSAQAGNTLLAGNLGLGTLSESAGLEVLLSSGAIYASSRAAGAQTQGVVYVLDASGASVLATIDGACTGQAPFDPLTNIAVDQATGNVLLFEQGLGIVYELSTSGTCVSHIGPVFGEGDAVHTSPTVDVAVDNGASSPGQGGVYITSGETFGSYASTEKLYAYGPAVEGAPPTVVTRPATAVTPTAATLAGTVNPNGVPLTGCSFEYVGEAQFQLDGFSSAQAASCSEPLGEIGEGSAPVEVGAELESLEPGAYRYRLVAENAVGAANGATRVFGPPSVEGEFAFPVSYTEATIVPTIDPHGVPTVYWVEFGPTAALGSSTAEKEAGSGEAPVEGSAQLTGLSPDSTYHYRVAAQNGAGTVFGADRVLRTLAAPSSEACPNDALRTGFSSSLPGCRAYELVTPPSTNGLPPIWLGGEQAGGAFDSWLVTPGGNSLAFSVSGSLPGTNGNGVIDAYTAVREDGGWGLTQISPSGEQTSFPLHGGISPDHAYSFWMAMGTGGSLDDEGGGHYVRMSDGTFELFGRGSIATDPDAVGRWITAGATHLIFTSDVQLEPGAPSAPGPGPGSVAAIYDRTPDGQTHPVSLLPGNKVPPPGSATFYEGASTDGSAVVFRVGGTMYERRDNATTVTVASGSPVFAGVSENGERVFYERGGGLYAFDADQQATTQIAAGDEAVFVNVSADGSHAYFASEGQLDGEEGVLGEPNLYAWDGATASFVATLQDNDLWTSEAEGELTQEHGLGMWAAAIGSASSPGPAADPSRTTPDGRILVFESHGDLTGAESAGHSQVFRYDAASGDLQCVSCSAMGGPVTAESTLQPYYEPASPVDGLAHIPSITADGSEVFFQTRVSLIPTDVNGTMDVYAWESGELSLISSGHGSADSYLYAMTPDGRDVFFTTYESLVAQDSVEPALSIYDAREGGGFAAPPQAAPCAGDECQGQPSGAPPVAAVPSASFQGPGNVTPRRRHARGRHHRHRRRHSRACRRDPRSCHRGHRQGGHGR